MNVNVILLLILIQFFCDVYCNLDKYRNPDVLKVIIGEEITRSKRQVISQNEANYSACSTPDGRIGRCKPINRCRIPQLKNDVWKLIEQLCVIEKSSIGICCPDNYQSGLNTRFFPQTAPTGDVTDSSDQTRIVNRPEERGCGLTTKQFPKITGGRPAEADEWPWMAAILRHRFPNVHCGGALVTDRHVITAAHCIHRLTKDDVFIRLGEYDFQQFNETRSRDFRVATMVYHIDFNPQTFENDIALLKAERPTIFNTYIWPVCIPPIGENWENRNAIVIGWGTQFFGGPHSKILMEVTVPIWKQNECEKMFIERVDETVLCAGVSEGGRDSCQGDSGGPLLVQLPNRRWIVVGIVSWGIRCGEKNRPGLYTRVDKYLPWIVENSDI